MKNLQLWFFFFLIYNGSGFGSGFCSPEKWNLRSGSGPVLAKTFRPDSSSSYPANQ
jgi:hypothetical protein